MNYQDESATTSASIPGVSPRTAISPERMRRAMLIGGTVILIVIGWIGSYLFRVVTGNMTYMQQRREYRSRYESATEDELQKQFGALPVAEQERLLRDLGQLDDSADPGGPIAP